MAVGALAIYPLFAQTAEMSTSWRGSYFYTDRRSPVPFELQMQIKDSKLTGNICEPATFGDFSKPYLRANVEGSVNETNIKFRKTYDGTGGARHSVEYEGEFKSTGREIVGVWEIGPTMRGGFSAVAIDPKNVSGTVPRRSYCPEVTTQSR